VATALDVAIQAEDGRIVRHCSGPLGDGSCPVAPPSGGRPPCAGQIVQPLSSYGRAGWELRVSPTATGCPLRAPRVWAKQPGRRWGPTATTA